jgi:drug/metabolite transporter (DMT)-like permease
MMRLSRSNLNHFNRSFHLNWIGDFMSQVRSAGTPAVWLVVSAFLAVYVIWGSTYLGIHYALETMPPFLMAGIRFLIAGGLLFSWVRLRGGEKPTRTHWRSSAIIGALLLMGGNGGVTWAEQHVPSSIAALLVANVPVWMVVLNWVRPDGVRPSVPVIIGLVVGLAGIALLVGLGDSSSAAVIDPLGIAVLVIASFCWASGSLYSQRASLPSSPLLTTGMEMLCGGFILFLVGTLSGEWSHFDPIHISAVSLFAVAYLIIFGAIIAFTAYGWLLRVTTPARAATYAYVNPVVAVFLGWALAGEALTVRTVMAAAVIILAVVIITSYRESPSAPKPVKAELSEVEKFNSVDAEGLVAPPVK